MTIGDNGKITVTNIILLPNHFATMRTDTNAVSCVVGKDYQIVQNSDAFAFFDAIVGVVMESCTRLQGYWGKGSIFL